MDKQALTIPEQLALLKERRLLLGSADVERMTSILLSRGYYRLSGYWRYFQKAPHHGDDDFQPGTTLASILDVYEFDEILRGHLLDGLGIFEIAFRTRIAYFFSVKCVPYNYRSLELYRDEAYEDRLTGELRQFRVDLVRDIDQELSRSHEDFVKSHRDRGKPIPIWVAVEVLSMGTISKMYRLLLDDDVRYPVSKTFGYPDPEFMESISRSFATLRNKAAHNARIWNHTCVNPPPVLKHLKTELDKGIYNRTPWSFIVMLAEAVDRIQKNDYFSKRLYGHIDAYPEFHSGLTHPHKR